MDSDRNKTVGWVIGHRDAQTFRQLYQQLEPYVEHYYTDTWEVYRKIIPSEKLTQSKRYTTGIERNNSNIRHYLGRMTRKTKVVSKSIEMVDISLRIAYCLNENGWYEHFQKIFLSIFN